MQHTEFTHSANDGAPLFFQSWAPDAPKALVCLIHGLGEHSGRYVQVARFLCEAGYAVLGFDLRGHGKSGGQLGHIAGASVWLDDIARLLDEASARFPGQPQFLYGHSLGGLLVLAFILERKASVAGVIASSPGFRPLFPIPPAKRALARAMAKVWPSMPLSSGLDPAGLSRDPEVIRLYGADPLVHDKVSARSGWDAIRMGESMMARPVQLPQVPLLLQQGTADRVVSHEATVEFSAKLGPICTLKLWPEMYHEIHNEPEQAEVLAFTIGWLDQHLPTN